MTDRVYQVGERAYYRERENTYKVRIMETESNNDIIKYTLRILQIIKSNLESKLKPGETIQIEKKTGLSTTWHLSDN